MRLYAEKQEPIEPVGPVHTVSRRPSIPVESDAARRRKSSPLLRAVRMRQPKGTRRPLPLGQAGRQDITQPDPQREVVADDQRAVADPRPSAAPVDRVKAEKLFLHGKRMLASNSLPRALQAFERALQLDPSSLDCALYEGWFC